MDAQQRVALDDLAPLRLLPRPRRGYYGAKKACEPVHVQYSDDDHSVYVVNSEYRPAGKVQVSVNLYDLHLKQLFSQKTTVAPEPDSSLKALTIPEENFSAASSIQFVELSLRNLQGEVVSHNFYWVPAKLTQFDWSRLTTRILQRLAMKTSRRCDSCRSASRVISGKNARRYYPGAFEECIQGACISGECR